VIRDHEQVNQRVSVWVEKQQQLNRKARYVEEGCRKNNIPIFGLQEKKNESYLETLGIVKKFLWDIMKELCD
jgi:coproporphyrinogen III oxidase